jgi:hypothetical protein
LGVLGKGVSLIPFLGFGKGGEGKGVNGGKGVVRGKLEEWKIEGKLFPVIGNLFFEIFLRKGGQF